MIPEIKPITATPDAAELAGRLAKVRVLMARENIDLYVSYDPINIYYLTNFFNYVHERPFILVIGPEGSPKMVVPTLEVPHVLNRSVCDLEIVSYFDYPMLEGGNWYDVYQSLIKDKDRVGVESAMTLEIFDRTPGNKVKTDIIEEVRLIKTEFELGKYAYACQLLSQGHEKLLEICRPDKMYIDIHNAVSQNIMSRVFTEIQYINILNTKVYGIVSPPSISHDPHNVTGIFIKMEHGGPHVSIVAGQIDGCGVELERTFFLGSVPETAKRPFQVMLEARALAYDMLKPGVNMGDIDRQVKKIFSKAGYLDKLLHRTGHGLGITGHEAPYIAEGYDRELAPGMLVGIEPGIYFPGLGGFRHSDTVVITDSGYVKLTQAPESLEELTIAL